MADLVFWVRELALRTEQGQDELLVADAKGDLTLNILVSKSVRMLPTSVLLHQVQLVLSFKGVLVKLIDISQMVLNVMMDDSGWLVLAVGETVVCLRFSARELVAVLTHLHRLNSLDWRSPYKANILVKVDWQRNRVLRYTRKFMRSSSAHEQMEAGQTEDSNQANNDFVKRYLRIIQESDSLNSSNLSVNVLESYSQDEMVNQYDEESLFNSKETRLDLLDQQQDKTDQFRDKPDQFREKSDQFQDQPDQFRDKPDQFRDKPDQFRDQPDQFRDQSDQFRDQPDQFWAQDKFPAFLDANCAMDWDAIFNSLDYGLDAAETKEMDAMPMSVFDIQF